MRTRGGLWPRAARPDASRRACSMLDTRGAGAAAAGRHVTLIAGRQEHGSESGQRPRPRVSATASTIPPGSRSEALDRPRQGLDRLDRQSLDLLRQSLDAALQQEQRLTATHITPRRRGARCPARCGASRPRRWLLRQETTSPVPWDPGAAPARAVRRASTLTVTLVPHSSADTPF